MPIWPTTVKAGDKPMTTTVRERVNKHRKLQREKARKFDALSTHIADAYRDFLTEKDKFFSDMKQAYLVAENEYLKKKGTPDEMSTDKMFTAFRLAVEKLVENLCEKAPGPDNLLAEPQNTEQKQPVADNVVPLKAIHTPYQYPWPLANAIANALDEGFSEQDVYNAYIIKAGMHGLSLTQDPGFGCRYAGETGKNSGITEDGKVMKLAGVKLPTKADNDARYQAEKEQNT
jgi:hypothetical protein